MDKREVEHRRELSRLKMLSWMKMVGACGNIFVEDRDFCMSMTFEKGSHILMVNEKTGFLDYVLVPEVEIASSGPSRFVAPAL